MFDSVESDVIYGPLDESEEAVAVANELADKNDDPDMQMSETVHVLLQDDCFNCFNDGKSKIDYILVYEDKHTGTIDELILPVPSGVNSEENDRAALALQKEKDKRQLFKRRFLSNLSKIGLLMESDVREGDRNFVYFIKIHIPWALLLKYAEDLNFRVPIRAVNNYSSKITFVDRIRHLLRLSHNPFSCEAPRRYYDLCTSVFEIAKTDRYMGNNKFPVHFTNIQRSFAVHEILQTTSFGRTEKGEIGIDRLIRDGVFQAAYSLHEGDYRFDKTEQPSPSNENNPRRILYDTWARYKFFYKYQPLDLIREYFGEKISLYFAWLGLYTTWLLPASLVGILVFCFGFIYLSNNVPANDVCTIGKNITMCPICDVCPYWQLSETCSYARIGVFFDHPGTVFYAIFMSFWAVTFLKSWKQKNAEITHRWDLMEFEEEENRPRPEFAIRASTVEKNPVTGILEPYFSATSRRYRVLSGVITLSVMICIVIIFIIAIIVYRIIVSISLFQSNELRQYALSVASISGAVINLIIIMVLGRLYEIIAYKLTQWEMHRTQNDFDNHFTIKVFIFQFVNIYSSIFYIAFIKGKAIGYPGHYVKILNLRQEECTQGGCLMELAIQLGIIMIGKQALSNIQEVMLPKILALYQRWQVSIPKTKSTTQWEDDFKHIPFGGLFEEYLEMVLQFGFITIFVAAFPVAPFFALINNWIEIRLDASKLVCATRRPIAFRSSTIGIWFNILQILAYLAIVANAFLIAFTSEFLPKILYQYTVNWDLIGYTNFTLAQAPVNTTSRECMYRDFRNPDGTLTVFFWKLLALRLFFVILFEHIVFLLCRLTDAIIDDIPESLSIKIRREKYLAKRALQDSSKLNQIIEETDEECESRSKFMNFFRPSRSKTAAATSNDIRRTH
ncbi:unnamed protein product [Rotaria magnacalcarata]|uniref:Anoctamin n=5 Tax=Rotaria magnacalcarata TaxID=392030 RepID=A0A819B4Y0_9BILA|nr:unnamed protein product [Rotaria magnacalcarata]CAF2216002.1 unnamed protein product [Rotaria magnacalcarata]CAF3795700.1 unnamed protein product [Rotaria magnacalcarata]CAF4003025.1 unnamed protein product [Rotaria magnacalcarata]